MAKAVGIHETHLGQFLLGRQGVSLDVLAKSAEILGAALLKEGDERNPTRIGSVSPDGRLMTDLSTIALPGFVEVTEACDDFKPGEEIYVRAASAFALNKWIIVERKTDHTRHFVKCIELEGERYLRTPQGDEWRYVSDRYRVIAQAYGGFRNY